MLGRKLSRESRISSPEGFAALFESTSRPILKYFARRVLDPHTAMDLTAETFAQAYRSRSRFRGDQGAEANWLFGIAKKQLALYHRRGAAERRALSKLGIEPPELSGADYERVEELAESARRRTAAQNGMLELSGAERDAVRLRIVDELSYADVAERLAISEDAARTRVSRGLRALGRKLASELDQEVTR